MEVRVIRELFLPSQGLLLEVQRDRHYELPASNQEDRREAQQRQAPTSVPPFDNLLLPQFFILLVNEEQEVDVEKGHQHHLQEAHLHRSIEGAVDVGLSVHAFKVLEDD